jgi:transcriptional regulator with XRE-family HTH domain
MDFVIPSEADPYRPPDWRWQRAVWLRDSRKYAKEDGEEVRVIRRYLLRRDKASNPQASFLLYRQFPGLAIADRIRHHNRNDVRWALEARLLADESLSSIAEKIGTTVEAVHWYEQAFFNVKPFLKRRDYIVNVVLGRSIHQGLYARDYDLIWKLAGYQYGPLLVDDLVTQHNQTTHCRTPAEALAARDELFTSGLRRKAAIAAYTVPVPYNELAIMELSLKLREIEQGKDDETAKHNLMLQNVQAALAALPFSVDDLPAAPPIIKQYASGPIELRADEMLVAARGGELPRLPLARQNLEAPDGEAHQ